MPADAPDSAPSTDYCQVSPKTCVAQEVCPGPCRAVITRSSIGASLGVMVQSVALKWAQDRFEAFLGSQRGWCSIRDLSVSNVEGTAPPATGLENAFATNESLLRAALTSNF